MRCLACCERRPQGRCIALAYFVANPFPLGVGAPAGRIGQEAMLDVGRYLLRVQGLDHDDRRIPDTHVRIIQTLVEVIPAGDDDGGQVPPADGAVQGRKDMLYGGHSPGGILGDLVKPVQHGQDPVAFHQLCGDRG
jgi:hypothetical protein